MKYLEKATITVELEPIYNVVKNLPLYKQRRKEEVFLGILKSKTKKWCGWNYLREIKKTRRFDDYDSFLELYVLALNFYYIQKQDISYASLLKNYNF